MMELDSQEWFSKVKAFDVISLMLQKLEKKMHILFLVLGVE
ncbi:MAG: hypothetical protein QXJ95_07350 [Ignisphaera sp.]